MICRVGRRVVGEVDGGKVVPSCPDERRGDRTIRRGWCGMPSCGQNRQAGRAGPAENTSVT